MTKDLSALSTEALQRQLAEMEGLSALSTKELQRQLAQIEGAPQKTAPADLKTKYASSDDWFKRSAPGAPPKPKAPKLDFAKTFADIEARKLYRVDPDPAELFPGGQRGTMPSAGMPTALEMRELASGKKETATPLDAVVRFGTRAIPPTLAAMTAAPSGAALGSPLGPVGAAVGALGVGTLAGISTAMAQEQGLKMLPERFKESVGQADWQLEAAARERPRYALFGSMAPSVLTGRPTRAIKPLLGGAVLGGGGEAVSEFVSDQPLNLGNIAMALYVLLQLRRLRPGDGIGSLFERRREVRA